MMIVKTRFMLVKYTYPKTYNIDRVDKKDVAEIFACKICERFPKVGLVSIHCFHVFCNDCIQNFKTNVKTSKCPAVNCEQKLLLKSIVGWMERIHKSVLIKCHNKGCGESFNIDNIETHQSVCQKFQEPRHKRKLSLVKTRSPSIISEANKMLDNLKVWCEKAKVSVCEFLLFSLKSQIENEAPSLKKQVDKLVNMYSGKDDIGEDRKRSA